MFSISQSEYKTFPRILFSVILIVCFLVFLIPLIAFGAISQNYKLDQEGIGFVEFGGSSNNFKLKATIGSAGTKKSTSANYIINHGRFWAVTESSSSNPGSTGNPGSSGGGGGGGTTIAQTGATFSGRAYPMSSVRLLKDGQIIVTTVAGPDAHFSITAININTGSHIFMIVGVDDNGLNSQSQSFPINVSSGVTTQISGIFLAPTLATDKSEVRYGDNLKIFGQTAPESLVIIGVASEEETFRTTNADNNGIFLYNLDTSSLAKGSHETRAKSSQAGAISDFGHKIDFIVGNRNVSRKTFNYTKRGDLNNDGRVNLVDFSIAGFWYEKRLSEQTRALELAQLNGDNIINLTDLSIMAFYWTG